VAVEEVDGKQLVVNSGGTLREPQGERLAESGQQTAGSGDMASPRANKRGGPKTAVGKAVVRRNPIKHGVLAQTPVISLVEREEDWERLRSGIFEYFEPQGAMEEELADRIAGFAWRLRRAVRAETESVAQRVQDVPEDWRFLRALQGLPEVRRVRPEHVEEMNRMLVERLAPSPEVIDRIGRYEKSLHRQMLQCIQQLLVLRGLRLGAFSRQPSAGRNGPVVSVEGYERRGPNRRVDRAPLDAVRGEAGFDGA
jgi:hypothetical protein